jgi:hypothetical protein
MSTYSGQRIALRVPIVPLFSDTVLKKWEFSVQEEALSMAP